MAAFTTNDPRFVGYKALSNRAGSQPTSLACLTTETRSSIVVSGSTIGNCCPTAISCDFPTTCLLGTLFYYGTTRVCGVSSDCNSFTVLQTSADIEQPSTVDYFCYETQTTWPYPTLYITDPALEATSSGNNASSGRPSATGPSHSSKAWIAGVVIGVLAFFGLMAVGSFCLIKKRRRQGESIAITQNHPYSGKPELDSSTKYDHATGREKVLAGEGRTSSYGIQQEPTITVRPDDIAQRGYELLDHYLPPEMGVQETIQRHETPRDRSELPVLPTELEGHRHIPAR